MALFVYATGPVAIIASGVWELVNVLVNSTRRTRTIHALPVPDSRVAQKATSTRKIGAEKYKETHA
jgi:hypothetical protein